jgi:hypothetical protein
MAYLLPNIRATLHCRQLGITTRHLSSGTSSKRSDADQSRASKGSKRANAKLKKQEEAQKEKEETIAFFNSSRGRLNLLKRLSLQGGLSQAEANKILDLSVPIDITESTKTPANARQRIEVSHANNGWSFNFLPQTSTATQLSSASQKRIAGGNSSPKARCGMERNMVMQ